MAQLSTLDEYLDAITRAESAAAAYYETDVERMSDAEYDQLIDAITEYISDHPDQASHADALLHRVAAGVSAGGDVPHDSPMLSLDKVTSLADIETFALKVEELGGTLSVEPKFDGMAINVRYKDGELDRVVTRGDGLSGEDITDRVLALGLSGLPTKVDWPGVLNVRGELLMTREDFTVTNRNRVAAGKPAFANPRNATAGTVRKADPTYLSQVTFVTYDNDHQFGNQRLHSLGFIPSGSIWSDGDASTLLEKVELFGVVRKDAEFDYPTDGIVIKVDELPVREKLGMTSRAPRWAVAYKYPADRATSRILGIEVGVGRTGNISYTAVLEPVFVDGSTVARATLHNPKFIADRDLRIGDTVEVHKANDIIPRVERSFPELRDGTQVPYVPSTVSPSGAPLDMSGEIWRSLDPADSIGALIAYAASRDAMDIDGLSTAIADVLVSGEVPLVNDLGDLFTLSEQQLADLDLTKLVLLDPKGPREEFSGAEARLAAYKNGTPVGSRRLGEKNAAKIYANIRGAERQPLNRVITALGIRKSGRTFGRRLAAHFHTMDALLAASYEDFLTSGVEGIGPERAQLFHDGFQRMRPVIEKMRAAGVNMGAQEPEAFKETEQVAGLNEKPLAGMKVVISGALTGPLAGTSRNEANELIEQYGGTASGSVSKATSLLVTTETTTSKAVKAAELGVRVVTPEEFATMIGRAR